MTNPMMKLIMILLLLVVWIEANNKLMKEEFSHTNVSKICLNFLASDPNSPQDDRVKLTGMVLHCLDSQLHILFNTSLSSIAGESQESKAVLEECNIGFVLAHFKVVKAEKLVVRGSYDKALNWVKYALENPRTCRDSLRRVTFNNSPQIYDQIVLYDSLSSAAITMIQRLISFT